MDYELTSGLLRKLAMTVDVQCDCEWALVNQTAKMTK
jgi:hypothetical protein